MPSIRSENAMLMTRNKLFLRSLFVNTKTTIVSKFPTTMKTDAKMKAVHHAMPSPLERTFVHESYEPLELLVTVGADDVLFIFVF